IHDMKMPLSTIAMVLDFWDKGKLDGKPEMERKYCLIAEEETQHLLTLANKVLTISKLENDKLEMNKAWVKLTPLLEKLMERFAAKATKKVNFVTDLKSDEVYADEEYLEEVLGNLIDNSIKYSDEEVTIRICSEEERNGCTISVRDDGWGISPKSQRVIFEKFERGDMLVKRHKKRVAGFGLGLNFVWQVVDAHGGRVALDSVEREYTEFELHFPKEGTDDMGND
ncbi:MAG: HAMP domain-containing histidine kinase, partial [Bacteroidaceae bacterium]|nr:HAMP domain-containing histidine kinase [Bacteroidaceae bacterium]